MGRASRAKEARRSATKTGTFYHFTSRAHLPRIYGTGYLKTTESNVSYNVDHAGPDVVWLLDVGEPGPRGTNGLDPFPPNPDNYPDKREIRFAVTCKAQRWLEWSDLQRMDREAKALLIGTGGGLEHAKHWWVCEDRIPRSAWLAVEQRQPNGSYGPLSSDLKYALDNALTTA
jgi:hypothetical protein